MYSRCCFFHDPLQYATSRDDAPPAEDQRRTDLSWRPRLSGFPCCELWPWLKPPTCGRCLPWGGKVRRRLYGMACQRGHFWIPLIQRSLANNWAPLKSSLIQKKIHIGHWGYPVSPWVEIGPRQFQSRRGNMLTLAIFFWATIYSKRLTDVRFRPTLRMHSSSQ